jgi:phosphoglycerate dehydrogenase-like enzyme
MQTINVLSTQLFSDDLLDRLRAVSPRLRVRQQACHDAAEVAAALTANVEVLYTYQVPDDVLTRAPHLRWIQLHSAGADHLLDNPVIQSEVFITTTSGLHAVRIAEYVFASILAFVYRLPLMLHYQHRHEWPDGRWKLFTGQELRGQTIGLVGYGSIGREVGRIAHALGMQVLVSKRSTRLVAASDEYHIPDTGDPEGALVSRLYPPDELTEMVAECDFVVVSTPLTPQTRRLINEAVLRAMKSNAYLVNIARGPVVDERALIRALRERWIAGAGLDVFEEEPLPADSPLWEMDNVIISPHVAGFTLRYDERAVEIFSENLRRYLAGERLLNLVNKERGY